MESNNVLNSLKVTLVLLIWEVLSFNFKAQSLLTKKKVARVEGNISLAFLHRVGIALHPSPFVSDIAIFVLKGDVKLQLTTY